MKFLKSIFFVVSVFTIVFPPATFAQNDDTVRIRGLMIKKSYDQKEADGVKVVVYKIAGTTFTPADPGQTFKAGDTIQVVLESNFDGFVYAINVMPSGKAKVIFPETEQGNVSNTVRANQLTRLPVFEFDTEKGIEVLQVVLSRDRIQVYEDAFKNSKGVLGINASSVAAELNQGPAVSENKTPVAKQVGIVAANSALQSVQSGGKPSSDTVRALGSSVRLRGLDIATPQKDQMEQGTILVATPDKPQADQPSPARLKSGEAVVFEIRLQHI